MHNETAVIKHLLKLGADGYLTKGSGKEEIVGAGKNIQPERVINDFAYPPHKKSQIIQ